MNQDLLLQALAQIWAQLPVFLGSSWDEFEAALLLRLRAAEAASPLRSSAAFDAVIELVKKCPEAYEQLQLAYSALDQEKVERGAPQIAGGVKYTRYLDVPVFYATDRAPASDVHAEPFFTGDRGRLSYGVVRVSVPDDHRRRTMAKPKWWKLQFRADPGRFVLVLGVESLQRALFTARARETLMQGPQPQAFVFIHGYNVSFADAARRAAQIAYDMEFEGLVMLYSWPSEGAVLRYPVDRCNATWTLPRFREFLTLVLSELGASRVHVIAHSMGNEVLANGLAQFDIAALPAGSAQLQDIVFAAPDVDAAVFRDLVAQFRRCATRCTLYASSKDKALAASELLQKYPRAGQSGEGLVVVKGVDTIDATELDTGLMSHSYVGDNTSIISDLFYLILQSLPADKRYLTATKHADGVYWSFKPQAT